MKSSIPQLLMLLTFTVPSAAAAAASEPTNVVQEYSSSYTSTKDSSIFNDVQISGPKIKENDDKQLDPSPWYDLFAQIAMALFAFGQFILTAVGIIFIRGTLKATKNAVYEAQKGSDAAVRMATISSEQFALERRPWISLQLVEASKPFQNMELAFKINFKNVGSSPALDLDTYFEMFIDDYEFTKIEIEFQNFLRNRILSHNGGSIVFPNEEKSIESHLQFSRRSLRTRDQKWSKRTIPKPPLTPWIFYTVLYRSPIKDANGHQTIHHSGGYFILSSKNGEILIGSPNLPEMLKMTTITTTSDKLVS